MKYQIGKKTHREGSSRRRPLRLCGRQTARRIAYERIRLSTLFEVAQLPEAKRPSLRRRLWHHLHVLCRHVRHRLAAFRARRRRVEKPSLLPSLCGALCGGGIFVCSAGGYGRRNFRVFHNLHGEVIPGAFSRARTVIYTVFGSGEKLEKMMGEVCRVSWVSSLVAYDLARTVFFCYSHHSLYKIVSVISVATAYV